jgi:penicillin-binding protein 1A
VFKGKWYIDLAFLRIPKQSIFIITIFLVSDENKTEGSNSPVRKATPRKTVRTEKHIIGFLFFICLLLTGFLGTMLFTLKSLEIPDLRSVETYAPAQASIIYDRHGKVIDRVFAENRTVVSLAEMSPLLPQAFVAAEDGRFYEHAGLDVLSVLRAAIVNARSGRKTQGGSTITQQVAKALLLTPEKTYIRKFKEAILAWRIDTLLSKDEIIYIYLNQIYLGEGAYGVEAAAHTYFGKTAADLTLAEVALLAGLPQAPSRYSPIKHFPRARARQRYVLNRMAEDGYVSVEAARSAWENTAQPQQKQSSFAEVNGYYLDTVKKQAEELIGRPLQEAGARIYTHLDQEMQRDADRSLVSGVKAAQARQALQNSRKRSEPQGALVCLERNSGRVRALVGGVDFSNSPFNRATQARRPAGSIFKPFVYAAALQSGWQPLSHISDAPLAIAGGKGGTWQPKNYSGEYHGDTTLETALAKSYNVAAVRLMQKVGVKKVHAMATAVGISAKLPPDLSLALGAVDVTLLDMTAAYGPFANEGRYIEPSFIDHIIYKGQRLSSDRQIREQTMTSSTALQMRNMLEGVVLHGTGKRAIGLPGITGGKTGTSNENRDAWFVGFNGNFVTGVWVGHDLNESLGNSENGGRTAVPIWRDFMGQVRGEANH